MNAITTEQLRSLPRFDVIALWLVTVTRTKAGRADVGGYRVTHKAGTYSVSQTEVTGAPVLFSGPADRLFDYARRTSLNALIQVVEEARHAACAVA